MFFPEVILIVTEGNLQRREFHFRNPIHCLVGQGEACTIRLGSGYGTRAVSRHHCLLEIDPPHVWVRDLGSLNGTIVNKKRIGRKSDEQGAEVNWETFVPHELQDGDIVRVGHVWIEVQRIAFAPENDEPLVAFPNVLYVIPCDANQDGPFSDKGACDENDFQPHATRCDSANRTLAFHQRGWEPVVD